MTAERNKRLIEEMTAALNDHEIDGIGAYFHEDFTWHGNAGCGVKPSLKAFQEGWQRPFLNAFKDKHTVNECTIAEGDTVAAFGRVEATHSGEFMGIAPTGKRVTVRYMDFWRIKDGKVIDNWVHVDVADTMRQLGVDPFQGHGWDARGTDAA